MESEENKCLIQVERNGRTTYVVDEWETHKEVLRRTSLLTFRDTDDLYYYDTDEFIYKNGGVPHVKRIIHDLLGQYNKTRHEKEIFNHLRNATYVDRDELEDNVPRLINLNNGVLDLSRNKLFRHDPRLRFLSKVPVTHDSGATCPKIQQFVSEILEEQDVPTFYELVGYCLQRDQRHKAFFIFVGKGCNGKSKLLELLQIFLGDDNVSCISYQELEHNQFAPSMLQNKLANVYSDLGRDAIEQNRVVKSITGGDWLSIERKYCMPVRTKIHAKLIFSCNELPVLKQDEDAIHKRINIFNCPNEFVGDKKDVDILNKVAIPSELSGLLNAALSSLAVLNTNNHFSSQLTLEEKRMRYYRMSDSVNCFIMDYVKENSEHSIGKQAVYDLYAMYCKINKVPLKSRTEFNKRIKQIDGVREVRATQLSGVSGRCWEGIFVSDEVYESILSSYNSLVS